MQLWQDNLKENNVPHGDSVTLVGTLGDPVKIRSWQISGMLINTLPTAFQCYHTM